MNLWDRQIFDFMTAPDGARPAVPFPIDAFRAVMKFMGEPVSLVGSIPGIEE
jgi:hypothetical protein